MHRGCFVWTPTLALSGRRAPRPGPPCLCACVPLLAGSGEPAPRACFGAPHLFLWSLWLRSSFAPPPPGWGCPVCGCCCVWSSSSFFFPSICAALLSLVFCVFRPRVPWALASCCPPAPPPFLFFLFFSLFFPLPPRSLFLACFSFVLFFCSHCFSLPVSFCAPPLSLAFRLFPPGVP